MYIHYNKHKRISNLEDSLQLALVQYLPFLAGYSRLIGFILHAQNPH